MKVLLEPIESFEWRYPTVEFSHLPCLTAASSYPFLVIKLIHLLVSTGGTLQAVNQCRHDWMGKHSQHPIL